MNLPVTMIAGCVGLSNATDGSTHHCINDISIMRTLPNLTILNPSCSYLSSEFAQQTYESKTPVYVRLDKGVFLEFTHNSQVGMDVLRWGDTMIVATGNMVSRALEIGCGVIDLYKLSSPDKEILHDLLFDAKQIITLEEHLTCGLGSIISEFLTDNNLHIPLKRIGIDFRPCPVGDREYLQKFYGLDVESIKNAIKT
jgi:transketolase